VPNGPTQNPTQSSSVVAAPAADSASTSINIDSTSPSSSAMQTNREPGDTQDTPESYNNYAYSCFLMQALTELLFSYDSCKFAFLSYSPKKRTQSPSKDSKYRTAALQFFLSDLVSFGTINSQPTTEARRRIMLCNWAMSVVVALCVDTSAGHDLKDVPADLVSVRKFVLEAISRSIKDLPLSDSVDSRYARLLALSDLCFRLLTVRFNAGARKTQEESPTHIAKVMLEKNFVATLTTALGDIDLNYPNIRTVVTAVLKPMEYLYGIIF
jgi:E3 ubiquitin-protein ligase HUWE1